MTSIQISSRQRQTLPRFLTHWPASLHRCQSIQNNHHNLLTGISQSISPLGQGTCLSHLRPISFLLFLTEQVSGESGSRVRQVRKIDVAGSAICLQNNVMNCHSYNKKPDVAGYAKEIVFSLKCCHSHNNVAGSAKEGPTTGFLYVLKIMLCIVILTTINQI